MKMPLSLDLRKGTLALKENYLRVMDADGRTVMHVLPDLTGRYDTGAAIVDVINSAFRLSETWRQVKDSNKTVDEDRREAIMASIGASLPRP